MKPRLLLALLAGVTLLNAARFEETFNVTNRHLELVNGATLGEPGSGVSGQPNDRAYIGAPSSVEQARNGPAALARAAIAPNSLTAFTCTFWYYLDETGPELQVPLSTAGVLFLMHDKGFEVRIENALEHPRSYVFTPGLVGPYHGWRDRGRWIFVAFSWEQKSNTFSIYQATAQKPVALMRDMQGPLPANASLPRTDLARDPEVIGNTARNLDRPLAGKLDNVRFYERVLTRADLVAIRAADLANEPVRGIR